MFKDKELWNLLVTEQNVKIEFLCRGFKIYCRDKDNYATTTQKKKLSNLFGGSSKWVRFNKKKH